MHAKKTCCLVCCLGLFALLWQVGCVASLSPLPGGKTLRKGQVRVHTGAGMNVSPKLIGGLADELFRTAQKVYDGDSTYTEEDGRRWIELGAIASLFSFSPMYEVGVQVGVTGWLDLGLRYAGGALSFGGQARLFKSGKWSATAGIQAGWVGFSPKSAPGLDKILKWVDFSRFDISIPVIAGFEFFGGSMVYGGLVYRGIVLSMEGALESATEQLAQTKLSSSVHMFGGVLGVRLGYKYVFAYAELGVHNAWWTPTILGKETPISTVVLYPTIGLMTEFN